VKVIQGGKRNVRIELLLRDGGRWVKRRRAQMLASYGSREEFIRIVGCTPEEFGRPRKEAGLYIVAKPKQLALDFAGESQREVERAMSDILERTQRKPKVG
jgi:hypothetical protein